MTARFAVVTLNIANFSILKRVSCGSLHGSTAEVRFTQVLARKGLLTAAKFNEAKQLAAETGLKLPEALIRSGIAAEEVVRVAEQYGVTYVNLKEVKIPAAVVELVPESIARENTIVPLAADDGQLTIVLSDPSEYELLDKLRFILNRRIDFALAPREAIESAINRYYSHGGGPAPGADDSGGAMAIDFAKADDALPGEGEAVDESSAPIVRLVHMIISEAVQLRASDIHVEPFEDRIRIRYRIDGVLVQRDSPPKRLLGPLLSRIKILSKLDIAERRRPQDGRIKVTIGNKELDFRVSVIPTNHGQSVVMRILDKANIKVGLKQLGFAPDDFKIFTNLIRRPNGIVLVTGPTGSGKTTSLYAALNELNTPDRKIITAEDPVEYYLAGINQVEIRHEIGLDFARVIRAMLRQAPNIILVGEMRDLETAQMGIQASLTGHLVFSTLHTNDAPSAITRLIDMGVPAYLVASTVIAILGQRLVRIVCPKCKQPHMPPQSLLDAAGVTAEMAARAKFAKGRGRAHCNGSGFRGRLGIFELMRMTTKIRELTFHEAATDEVRRAAVGEGMRTLYRDGIAKAMAGLTTIEEILETAKKGEDD